MNAAIEERPALYEIIETEPTPPRIRPRVLYTTSDPLDARCAADALKIAGESVEIVLSSVRDEE